MTSSDDILSAEALLAAAEADTGLRDYGDDTLPARFGLAVDYLRSVGMDEQGERAAASVCHWLLTSRLRFFEDRKRFAIADERIERPLFATGEPRSGTTLLHALLSVDPKARALRFWEVMYPSPPPGLAGTDDRRCAKADADWREILARIPKWIVSHPYNDMLGNGLPECERTWAFDFRVMTPTAWWRVPMGMKSSGLPADPRAQYRLHKMMLQHCQYQRPTKYWVLKGFHGARLAALFEAYPDARIIWVHRDPVQVIASRIMMSADITEGLTGRVDLKALAQEHLAASRASIQATLSNPLLEDSRVHHVRYPDFMADPVGTLRTFYESSGVPFTAETATSMRQYLERNKGDRHGKFRYSPEVICEDLGALHREFAPFRERFGLSVEQRS